MTLLGASSACTTASRKGGDAPPRPPTQHLLLTEARPEPKPVASASPTEAAQEAGPKLIVAGPEGLFEIGRDGAPRRRLGQTKATSFPRFSAAGDALIFVVNGEALHEYTFATQSERKLAGPWRSASKCGQRPGPPLNPKSDDDVVVDKDNQHVCLRLLDRHMNMANIWVSLRVDREALTLEQHSVLNFNCPTTLKQERFTCQPGIPIEPARAVFAHAWDEEKSTLTGTDGRSFTVGGQFMLVQTSPTGRWLMLRGNQEEGDYMHFNWLLVDLERGEVFALPEAVSAKAGDWLPAVQLTELADPSRPVLGTRAGDYVGETPVRFVDATLLLVGELLVDLQKRSSARIEGNLAY